MRAELERVFIILVAIETSIRNWGLVIDLAAILNACRHTGSKLYPDVDSGRSRSWDLSFQSFKYLQYELVFKARARSWVISLPPSVGTGALTIMIPSTGDQHFNIRKIVGFFTSIIISLTVEKLFEGRAIVAWFLTFKTASRSPLVHHHSRNVSIGSSKLFPKERGDSVEEPAFQYELQWLSHNTPLLFGWSSLLWWWQ